MRNDLLTFLANSLLIGEHDLDASKIKKLTMVTICNKQIFSYSERLNEKQMHFSHIAYYLINHRFTIFKVNRIKEEYFIF